MKKFKGSWYENYTQAAAAHGIGAKELQQYAFKHELSYGDALEQMASDGVSKYVEMKKQIMSKPWGAELVL